MASSAARRLRTASPEAAARAVHAKTPRFSESYQGWAPSTIDVGVNTAAVTRPARHVVDLSVLTATVNSATTTVIRNDTCRSCGECEAVPRTSSITARPLTRDSTVIG